MSMPTPPRSSRERGLCGGRYLSSSLVPALPCTLVSTPWLSTSFRNMPGEVVFMVSEVSLLREVDGKLYCHAWHMYTVCMYHGVCLYVCIMAYVCVMVYVCMYVSWHMSVCVYHGICMYVYIMAYVCIMAYVYVCIMAYVYIYVCIHHTFTHKKYEWPTL